MTITIKTGRLSGQSATVTYESSKSIRATLGDGSTVVLPKDSVLGIQYYEVSDARS
jgi:hypothetical protein